MQSADAQQMSGPKKNPYLSQYRNDISAKQREIRLRIGQDLSARSNLNPYEDYKSQRQSRDNIRSIDDEQVEQQAETKNLSSRYISTAIDDEAEASLQFFKRNLLPQSEFKLNQAPATGSRQDLTEPKNSRLVPISQKEPRPKPPVAPRSDLTKRLANSNGPSSFTDRASPVDRLPSPRPVPYKQSSLDDPRFSRDRALLDSIPPPRLSAIRPPPLFNNYAIEKPTNDQVNRLKYSSDLRQRSNQSKSSEKESSSRINSPDLAVNSRSKQSLEDRQSVQGSPSQDDRSSFSRKPIYNSLLRAHDSIRLKVNRPKVRPKSEVKVEDTALEDEPIPMNNLNHSQQDVYSNERPIDVRRGGSKRKSKLKKQAEENPELPIRNFADIRIVKVIRTSEERSLGVTVRAEDGNIVVARIMAGSLADKQGALQVGDIILSVNNCEVYTPEQIQEQLRKSINEDTVIMKIVPSFREELPTLCIYLRALFTYDANEDSLLPCKEVGVSFNQGDILEVVNQEDPNWWQARRVDSENLQTGLIPSQELEERRRAFVIPEYNLATRTSICGTKVNRKSKKKEVYNLGQNSDFDKAELQLYEEVCRTPAFERRTLVLIGANGIGKQALRARLVAMDPDRFGAPLPHTSRLAREGEEDGVHYHFITREKMEEDIIAGKYLECGEYDGALYGTKLDSVREIIGSGKVCVLDCSATCLKVLKTSDYLPFVAFIAAPTLDQLRYANDWARSSSRNYTTFDRALSRQSRRAKTLQDFAFDFFEDEDLQSTVEESARLFRIYENYFDIVLVNNNFERTFEQLRDAIDALSMAPQWIPISWIYGT